MAEAPTIENLLRQLRGDDVGRAVLAAPPCTRDSSATVDVVLEVERFGRVRFTLARFRERRFGRYFWTCDRAVLAE